ncbi:MAG TPA: hypothetical protein VGI86_10825 [Acidimicrobiia bacterium]
MKSWRHESVHRQCAACGETWDVDRRLARSRPASGGHARFGPTSVWAAPQRGAAEHTVDIAVHSALDQRDADSQRLEEIARVDLCPRCGSTEFAESA